MYATILQHFTLSSSGPPVRITRDKYELFDEHVLLLNLTYVFPQQVLALQMNSTMPDILGPGHVHLASVTLDGRLQEQILDNRNHTAFFTQSSGKWWQTLGRFVWLGIQHIATGYDHLAFLLGLLIATATLRSLVKVITSFTVAHSITLALATFNVVVLPSRFTESMIAASILYVAVENLIRKRTMDRWKLTFLFGLVHGFRILQRAARDATAACESGAIAVFVQPGSRDRASCVRCAIVPGDRGSDQIGLDHAAASGFDRDRLPGSLLVHPTRLLRLKEGRSLIIVPIRFWYSFNSEQ